MVTKDLDLDLLLLEESEEDEGDDPDLSDVEHTELIGDLEGLACSSLCETFSHCASHSLDQEL